MVGLSGIEVAQFRELLSVRRRLSFRRFKGRPQEAVLTGVFLVLALPTPIMLATFSAVAYRKLSAPWDAELAGGILVLLWVLWLLMPILGVSFNESPDLSKLLTLPIRRRVMILATIAGSIFDYSTFFTLPFLIAVVLGGWGSAAILVAVPAVIIAAAHLIVAGQLTTTITSGLVRSRRFRDLLTVAGSLIALTYWWFRFRTIRSEPHVGDFVERLVENNVHPLHVLQWTPPGACARAIERASAGHVVEALAWLAGSMVALVVLARAWWWAQDRVATQGEFVLGAPARRPPATTSRPVRGVTPSIPLVRPGVLAVARLELQQTWRSPRRRMQVINGLLMPVVFGALWFGREKLSGPMFALAPGSFVILVALVVFQNLMAVDGLAVATVLLSPLDRRDVFRGKALAFAVVVAGPVLILCVLSALRVPAPFAISAALLAAASFLVVTAVSAGVSARVAVPIPADRRAGPVRANTAAGWTISLLQPIIISALLAPFWVPAAIATMTGRPALALGAAAAGLVYATVLFHYGIKNAGAALLAREPEIFKMLDPKAA